MFIAGQSFWSLAVDDNGFNKSRTTDNVLFQDTIILAGGFVNDAACRYHQLFAYNLSGDRLWNIGGFHDRIYCDSDYIYTTGYTGHGEIIEGYQQIVIAKYDKFGNEIFSIAYPETPHNADVFKPNSIDIATDGTILVSSVNSILKSNIDGLEIQEYEIELDADINEIQSLDALTYFIRTDNKIFKTDDSFLILESLEFSNTIKALRINDEYIYTLLDACMIELDSDLNIVDTIVSGAQHYNNMYIYASSFWLQANVEDSIVLYRFTDLNLDEIKIFPTFVNNADFILAQNNYVFVGNSLTDQIGIYNFDLEIDENINVSLPDCELLDFNIDNINIEYVQLNETDSLAIGFRFDAELIIRNNGNENINSIAIFADLEGGYSCEQNYYYQKFTEISILPSEELILNLEQVYQDGINNNQICFQCLAAKSELEIQIKNNTLCKDFVISELINIIRADMQVYPNPFADYLNIENPNTDIEFIDIIDISGKAIIRNKVSGNSIKIKTTSLKSGVYILKTHSKTNIETRLIIKN